MIQLRFLLAVMSLHNSMNAIYFYYILLRKHKVDQKNPVFQSNNAQMNKDVEDESHFQQEDKDTLALLLPAPINCRVQLNAMCKSRVTDENKRINLHVMIKSNKLIK